MLTGLGGGTAPVDPTLAMLVLLPDIAEDDAMRENDTPPEVPEEETWSTLALREPGPM